MNNISDGPVYQAGTLKPNCGECRYAAKTVDKTLYEKLEANAYYSNHVGEYVKENIPFSYSARGGMFGFFSVRHFKKF